MQRCERCALFFFLLFILLFSFFFFSPPCRAEEPSVHASQDLITELITELRWDNLESCQDEQDKRVACLSDKQPRSDRKLGMHIFHLAPGESVRFQLPPFSFLRVFSAEKKLTDDALHCLLSNGSGLQTKVSPLRTKDKKNLLIKAVAPLLVQLTRPAQGSSQKKQEDHSKNLSFAVFVSRTRTLPATLDTAKVLPLSGNSFSVEDAGAQHSFWPISADQEAALEEEIEGPARLVLETRLVYPTWYQQQSQSYQVELSGDKIVPSLFLIRTTTDEDRLLLTEEDPMVLGQLRKRYLQIPEGRHRLRLQASQDILARLIRLDKDAYLFPGRNRVAHDERQDKQDNYKQAEDKTRWSTSWNYDEEQLQSLVAKQLRPQPLQSGHLQSEQLIPEQVFPIAQALIRDYRHPDSPLLAAQLLTNMQELDKSDLHREEAQQLIHAASFYQDLFPAEQTPGQINQECRRYLLPKLKGRRESQLVLAEQFGEALINAVGRGYFFDLAPSDAPSDAPPDTKKTSNELHFQLPDQPVPYHLRILAEHLPSLTSPEAKPLSFLLITDTGHEQEFTLLPHQERPDTAYRITRAEAGALVEYLDLPWKRKTEPQHPLIKAASYDLVLPAQVKEIYLRPKRGNKTDLSLAVKIRKARPFLLSQEEFLAADLAAGSNQTSFSDLNALIASWPALPKIEEKSSLRQSLRLDRLSQYIFLVRAMKSLSAHIPASVVPLSPTALSPIKHKDSPNKQKKKHKKILSQARAAQKAGDWLQALDLWSRAIGTAINRAEDNSMNEARLGQAEALIRLGEVNMARTLLRGLLLYPQGQHKEALSQAAFERLEAFYQDRQDDPALLSLYAVRFLHKPDQQALQQFADQALQRGQFDLALFASLILKPEQRNHGTLIRAALHKGWSEVARQEISMLSRPEDKEQQRYWQALLEPGSSQSAQTAPGLFLPQAELPQPESWLIRSHAGQALLYNPSRDLTTQYFLASPEEPIILDVQGPVQLELTARPVHHSADSRVDDWLEIRQGKNIQALPINKNGPASGLVFRENFREKSDRLPGRAVRTGYIVGPGKQRIRIAGRNTALMVQIAALRPERAFVDAQPRKKQTEDSLSCLGEDCLILHNHIKESLRSWSASRLRHILANIMEEEMRRFDTAELSPHPEKQHYISRDLPREQASKKGNRSITLPPLPPSALLLTAAQEKEELLALTKQCTQQEQQDKDPLLCMIALVRLGERFPEQKKLAAVQAEMLRLTFLDQPELVAPASRLVQSGGWQAAHFVNSEEGIRFITEPQEWRPESPALAHRKALLGLHQGEQILFDKKPLVLNMDNLHQTKLTVTLTLAEIPYAPPRPMKLHLQIDGKKVESLLLSQHQPVHKKTLRLGKGHHQVTIQLAERSANQFLRVHLDEPGVHQEAGWTAPKEKSWYVSSRKHPVQVRIQGPGLVWTVEATGGGSEQRKKSYHLVRKGWQEIVLPPSSGRGSLFRVFQRVWGGGTDLKAAPEQEQKISFPAPLFSLDRIHPDYVSLRDGYPLGMQEEGSWAWGAGLYRRKAQEDTADEATENFFQLTGAYRLYRETYEEYFRTQGLVRFLDAGGTVFGLGQNYRRLLDWRPFSLTAAADFLMQVPESEVSESNNQGSTAMSLHLRTTLAGKYQLAGKTWHVPSISAFARWMTPDGSDRVGQNIDQDIYTQYKEDHRYGMAFSETLHYRPWLDSQFSTGLRLATNENIVSPDYLRFRCGLRQLIWPFQADITYTGIYYFDDNDREEDILKNSVSLDLTADHWQQNQRRLRLGLRLRTDLDTGEQLGFLRFSWIFSKSRGVRDFQPIELPFKNLRERMLFDTENNTIQYE
ncbi:hypothetical protein KKHLCK_06850 [Candidatus Electrothrix laxa]